MRQTIRRTIATLTAVAVVLAWPPLAGNAIPSDSPGQHPDFPPPPPDCELWTVTRVTDGDTVVATNGVRSESIRYIGMDTPERGWPLASEASAYNRQLIGDQIICVATDVSERDRYGRLLRYLWRASDGLFINGELVLTGLAVAARYSPDVQYADLFTQLQREATSAKIGLWSRRRIFLPAISGGVATATPPPSSPAIQTELIPETAQQTAVRSESADELYLMGEIANRSADWITGRNVGQIDFLAADGAMVATAAVSLRVEALPPGALDCFRVQWPPEAARWQFRNEARKPYDGRRYVKLIELASELKVEPNSGGPGFAADFTTTMRNAHTSTVDGGDVSFTLFGRHGRVVGCNYRWLDGLDPGAVGSAGYRTSVARNSDEPVRMSVSAFAEVK